MLRRILVTLDSSDFTPVAIRFAAEIAQAGQKAKTGTAAVVGLAVVDTDQLPVGRFAAMVPREQLLNDARAQAEAISNEFRALTGKLGMKKALVEARTVTGSPFREIIREGVFCDLIVMTRTCSFPPANNDYDTATHLFHRSSRPIVIAADTFRPVKKVIMAMNGTAPSSRLMYAYAQLNAFPRANLKVVYSEQEEAEYHLTDFFGKVKAYLKSYGLKAELVSLPGNFEENLAAQVKADQADLLAMGIPGEHFLDKFRETLHLQTHPVQRMLEETGAALFTVH
jgi:nucleotide-binding universal stress UspA family protein